MAEPIIYKGRGTPEMYDDLMDFMNYVFSFNGNEEDFLKLLPKLYKKEYNPCYNNYVVTENGKLRAAIGAFDSELSVGGKVLKCRGIGNVAVHPYHRSKGYMIDCMNNAINDMLADGVDFSILGGQRQRYEYFGFESAGPAYRIGINSTNMRHVFRDVPFTDLEIRDVKADDEETIQKMYDLFCTRPLRTLRSREAFYDIMCSWFSKPRAIFKDGEFIGYFVESLQELTLTDMSYVNDVVRNFIKKLYDVEVTVPAWNTELINALLPLCEGYSVHHCDCFNIFNFRNFIDAFLTFKTSVETLADGSCTLLIHGLAGDFSLKLTVKDNVATVEDYCGTPDLELEHRDAIQFLFSNYSGYRAKLKPEVRSWFPLPLFVDNADHV